MHSTQHGRGVVWLRPLLSLAMLWVGRPPPSYLNTSAVKMMWQLLLWTIPSAGPPEEFFHFWNVDRSRNQAWHVPRPPPRTVRLLGPESAWGCSRSDGLGLRIPKMVWKAQFGGRTAVLGPGEETLYIKSSKSKNLTYIPSGGNFFKQNVSKLAQYQFHSLPNIKEGDFRSTKSMRHPCKGVRVNIRQIQILTFFQCGNGLFTNPKVIFWF